MKSDGAGDGFAAVAARSVVSSTDRSATSFSAA